MNPDVGTPPAPPPPATTVRLRNPGRRGYAADCYLFPVRMPLEESLRGDREYRRLRYEFDRLERRLSILSRSGYASARLKTVQDSILRAGNACAEYMIRHLPVAEPPPATILTRELGADGTLESESEVSVSEPVAGTP